MAFSNIFRRYSTSYDNQPTSYAYIEANSIAETLLEELESQCQNSLQILSEKNKRNAQILNESNPEKMSSTTKRHSSVDYSWLTPNKNLLQATTEIYHLSEIIKMELCELIRNVLAEDCRLIINQFRSNIRAQTKSTTPENVIALFRKTIAEYIDQKSKNRSNTNDVNHVNTKSNIKPVSTGHSFVRNNRINPKHQRDDEQHCIAELTEISISSSSNDGIDNKARLNTHK